MLSLARTVSAPVFGTTAVTAAAAPVAAGAAAAPAVPAELGDRAGNDLPVSAVDVTPAGTTAVHTRAVGTLPAGPGGGAGGGRAAAAGRAHPLPPSGM